MNQNDKTDANAAYAPEDTSINDDYTGIDRDILLLFTKASSRKEYLDRLATLLSSRTECRCIAFRVLDREGYVPFEHQCGFSREFCASESWLSLQEDQCACTRVISGRLERQDLPFTTPGGSFYCNDTAAFLAGISPENTARYRGTCMRHGFQSLAVIPIHRDNRILGAIQLADEEKGKVPLSKILFVESLVPLIAEAMLRFNAEEELQRNFDGLKAINAILRLLQESIPLSELLEQVLLILSSTSRISLEPRGALFLTGEENGILHMAAQTGLPPALIERCSSISFGTCLCGRAASTREIQFGNCQDFCRLESSFGVPPHSHYCVPICSFDQTIGVINLYTAPNHRRKLEETDFLHAVANTLVGIIEHRKTEDALKKSEASLAEAQRIASLGHWEWNIEKNELYWSKEIYRIFGVEPQLFGVTYDAFLEAVHPEDRDLVVNSVNEALQNKISYNLDHRIIRSDGSVRFVQEQAKVIFNADGRAVKMIGTVQDITERKRMEEQLKHLATHDPLTNIANRFTLEENLKRAVAKGKRGRQSALLLIDIDNFSLLNESLGYAAGDEFLINLVALLKENLREEDLLARVGGDEFAVLLEEEDEKEAADVAGKLHRSIDEIEFRFRLSASIGIFVIDGGLEAEKILSMASIGLDTAKEGGKNRVVLLNNREDSTAVLCETNQIVRLLRSALKENLFELHFQPVIDINSKEVSHHEVLLRLYDSDKKVLLPGKFISLAEKFGLMPQIDYWVTGAALKALKKYPHVKLFINISGVSLGDEDLLDRIEADILSSKIDPSRLGFEITETAAVKDLVMAGHWIKRLRSMGCRFALDDFGIGFSSFSYLKLLAVDFIKIDGFFIRNLDKETDQRIMVQAINFVAHALGKKTIAEFVENERILAILQEIEIDQGQGYYLGQPGPVPLQ